MQKQAGSLANTIWDLELWEAGGHAPRCVAGSWERSSDLPLACTFSPGSESVARLLAACTRFVSSPGSTSKEARGGLKGRQLRGAVLLKASKEQD